MILVELVEPPLYSNSSKIQGLDYYAKPAIAFEYCPPEYPGVGVWVTVPVAPSFIKMYCDDPFLVKSKTSVNPLVGVIVEDSNSPVPLTWITVPVLLPILTVPVGLFKLDVLDESIVLTPPGSLNTASPNASPVRVPVWLIVNVSTLVDRELETEHLKIDDTVKLLLCVPSVTLVQVFPFESDTENIGGVWVAELDRTRPLKASMAVSPDEISIGISNVVPEKNILSVSVATDPPVPPPDGGESATIGAEIVCVLIKA